MLRIQSGSFQVGSDRYAIDYRSRSSRRRRRDVDDTTGHVVIKRDASQPLDVDKPSGTTHTHPFNGHFSGTTRVSRYQKGKPVWILRKQETVSGSGISWAACKSAPRFRQITTPAPHRSVLYRPGALAATQPTASKQPVRYYLKASSHRHARHEKTVAPASRPPP